jgi:hypothetical protein
LAKIREMVKNLKGDHVTEEVSGALEPMNNEIARISPNQKTPAESREQNISKGIVSLFSGTGLTVFLYYFSAALVLKLPPHIVAQIPFEIDPVVRIIWLLGLIPTLSGLGHIVAGLLIRPQRYELQEAERRRIEQVEFPRSTLSKTASIPSVPDSVTDHTTELLQQKSVR